jgi:uncharacterized protein (TIGR01777 family)
MQRKILITGGTGLVGSALTEILIQRGYEVVLLSRNAGTKGKVRSYQWDYTKKYADPAAFEGIHAIVHLAGAGIADKRWNDTRKHEIISSRVETAQLLLEMVKQTGHTPEVFVTASGINYYGSVTTEHIFRESDPPADSFIGQCCFLWEAAADAFSPLCRVVKLRTGVVLSPKGGALEKIAAPARYGFGAPLGSGKQYVPWIHLDDLCTLYLECIEKPAFAGAYNAVAPEYITNTQLTKGVAQALQKPLWLPNVPGFALKLALGELAEIVLEGSMASAEKLIKAGFKFKYHSAEEALRSLLAK